MTKRRQAREWAVQLLFQLDLNPSELDEAMEGFWQDKTPDEATKQFTEELVRGVRGNLDKIDGALKQYAENWDVARMGNVDRNVMRLALFEMIFREDIPAVVSINEAVDIVKYFSSNESGRFVNGVLDRARKDLRKNG